MRPFSHFQPILQLDLRPWYVTFDLMNIWRFPYIIPINQVWFQSDFNFSNEVNFTFFSPSYNLTSDDLWPWYVTFDLMNIWRFPYYTNKSSLVPIGLPTFQMKSISTFSAYLTSWPQMTFDLDMWPLTSSTNEGSHVASMTQLWLKSIKA